MPAHRFHGLAAVALLDGVDQRVVFRERRIIGRRTRRRIQPFPHHGAPYIVNSAMNLQQQRISGRLRDQPMQPTIERLVVLPRFRLAHLLRQNAHRLDLFEGGVDGGQTRKFRFEQETRFHRIARAGAIPETVEARDSEIRRSANERPTANLAREVTVQFQPRKRFADLVTRNAELGSELSLRRKAGTGTTLDQSSQQVDHRRSFLQPIATNLYYAAFQFTRAGPNQNCCIRDVDTEPIQDNGATN